MKQSNHILRKSCSLLGAIVALIAASSTLTSCVGWDEGWDPMPPVGWNYFYDNTLTGNWQLIQINARPVRGDETNYLSFNGRGYGWYYYYRNGALFREQTAYWCQDAPGGYTQINLQYESGSASTMNYWFTNRDNYLWMSWNTAAGTMTYVYQYVNQIP